MKNIKIRLSVEWFIYNAFLTSRLKCGAFIPWEQGALLYKINNKRNALGYPRINNSQLAKVLSKMKSSGKIDRLRWFNPSSGNIWLLKASQPQPAACE